MSLIRLAIVDTNDLTRHGIVQIVKHESHGQIQIAGAYPDLIQLSDKLKLDPVDILMLDDALLKLGNVDDYIQQLKQCYPGLSVVVTSYQLSSLYIKRILEAGASGFIYKSDRFQGFLIPALKLIQKGEIYVSPQVNLVTYMMKSQSNLALTETDRDVLWMLANGYNTKEIATLASISPRSVYRIRNKLRQVLDVRTNEQIVDEARKRGLLDLSEPD